MEMIRTFNISCLQQSSHSSSSDKVKLKYRRNWSPGDGWLQEGLVGWKAYRSQLITKTSEIILNNFLIVISPRVWWKSSQPITTFNQQVEPENRNIFIIIIIALSNWISHNNGESSNCSLSRLLMGCWGGDEDSHSHPQHQQQSWNSFQIPDYNEYKKQIPFRLRDDESLFLFVE